MNDLRIFGGPALRARMGERGAVILELENGVRLRLWLPALRVALDFHEYIYLKHLPSSMTEWS